MAITIKEIHVRTTIVAETKKEEGITAEMLRSLKEDILRELKEELSQTNIKRER